MRNIFKNTFCTEHIRVTASVSLKLFYVLKTMQKKKSMVGGDCRLFANRRCEKKEKEC